MNELKHTLKPMARLRISQGKPLKEDLLSSAEVVIESQHWSAGRSHYFKDANNPKAHGTAGLYPHMFGLPEHAGFRYRVTFELLPPLSEFDPDVNPWEKQEAARMKPVLRKKKDPAHPHALKATQRWKDSQTAIRWHRRLHEYLRKLFGISIIK